jgi:hypothetical protein
MDSPQSVDTNILHRCYEPQGLLFKGCLREYGSLFEDLSDKRTTSHRDMLEALADSPGEESRFGRLFISETMSAFV